MSRIRTDLRPAMGSNRRSASHKSLPPVRSPRGTRTPELDWEADMVQSLQVRAVSLKHGKGLLTSPKEPSVRKERKMSRTPSTVLPQPGKTQQDENAKLKNEIENLKAKIASLQKVIEGQKSDISEKSVAISELEEKSKMQVEDYEKQIRKLRHSLSECKKENDELEKKLKESTEEIKTMKEMFDKEKEEIKKKSAQQLANMAATHEKELAERDEKLKVLKTRMADALGDNSRERQQQLEELTRELKRVTEESEVIKSKLVSTKSSNQGKCKNCSVLEKQLQSKIMEAKDREVTVIDLQQLCGKMERQLVQQDELLRQWAKSQGKKIK